MNKYILQMQMLDKSWMDLWKIESLRLARAYKKRMQQRGQKARIVREV